MFTLAFWRATFERAISTAAQAALALLSADGLGVLDVDWGQIGSVVALAAGLAVLKALAAAGIGNAGPGFGAAETLTPAVAAEAAPASPTGLVAGPAADVPVGEPVEVTASVGDGLGDSVGDVADSIYGGDTKTDAAYLGRQE